VFFEGFSGDFFRLEEGLEFISIEVFNERSDVFLGDFLFEEELSQVLGDLDNSDSGGLVFTDTDEFGQSTTEIVFDVSEREGELLLGFQSDRLENLQSFISGIVILFNKEDSVQSFTEDSLGGSLVERHNSRESVVFNEFFELINIEFFSKSLSFITISGENDDVVFLDFILGSSIFRGGAEEDDFINIASNRGIVLEGISGSRSEEDGDSIIILNMLFNIFNRGDFKRWGTSLLLQPGDNFRSSSATVIVNGFSLTLSEEFESGIATDFESFGKGTFFSSINLAELDFGVGFSESLSGFGVFGGEVLAVTTPRSVEFD